MLRPKGVGRFSVPRLCSWYKENNVYNIYVKPKENKIDAMPLSGDSESGDCRLGPKPVKAENPEVPGEARDPEVPGGARDPEVPGGAHDLMRDDVDGDEAMVPRVPNLPPEPSARQIAEHELTGHAVSSLRCVEGSSACAFLTRGRRVAENWHRLLLLWS